MVNSNGYCKHCFTQSIHYGIENGSYTYFCEKCNKKLNKEEVLTEKEIESKALICKRCGKQIDELECFSGQLCVDCYEREYENLTEEEKKPDFIKTLNK